MDVREMLGGWLLSAYDQKAPITVKRTKPRRRIALWRGSLMR